MTEVVKNRALSQSRLALFLRRLRTRGGRFVGANRRIPLKCAFDQSVDVGVNALRVIAGRYHKNDDPLFGDAVDGAEA